MRNIILAVFILITFLSLFSCKKDIRNSLDPVIPYDSVTRLTKLVFIDTSISPTDTIGYRDYIYDNMHRVTNINFYDFQDTLFTLTRIIKFNYSGSDSLPLSSTNTDEDTTSTDSNTKYYTYNTLLQLIEDSAVNALGYSVSRYTYSGDTIFAQHKDLIYSLPFTPALYTDAAVIFSNNNPATAYGLSPLLQQYNHSFSYDTLSNPFYQLNIHYAYTPVPKWAYNIYDNNLQQNNTTFLRDESPGSAGSPDNQYYTYIYNAEGYPVIVYISYAVTPANNRKIIFIYKGV